MVAEPGKTFCKESNCLGALSCVGLTWPRCDHWHFWERVGSWLVLPLDFRNENLLYLPDHGNSGNSYYLTEQREKNEIMLINKTITKFTQGYDHWIGIVQMNMIRCGPMPNLYPYRYGLFVSINERHFAKRVAVTLLSNHANDAKLCVFSHAQLIINLIFMKPTQCQESASYLLKQTFSSLYRQRADVQFVHTETDKIRERELVRRRNRSFKKTRDGFDAFSAFSFAHARAMDEIQTHVQCLFTLLLVNQWFDHRKRTPYWSTHVGTAKKRWASTGPFACPLVCSLIPLTHLLDLTRFTHALHCAHSLLN